MKCLTHPAVDAITNCSVCNSPLCDECDVSVDGSNAICSRCIALAAVSDFGEAEAEQAYQRALSILESIYEEDHPDTAETLENYATLLRQMERVEEAESTEQRASTIRNSR